MLHVLTDALKSDGYDVLTVGDGSALLLALAQSNRHHYDVVDLVITDVRMPKYSGLQAVETIRAIRPRVRVLVVTAFPDEVTAARARKLDAELLEKPFSVDRLRTAVRDMLNREPRR